MRFTETILSIFIFNFSVAMGHAVVFRSEFSTFLRVLRLSRQ
jgi:hypothetical protein